MGRSFAKCLSGFDCKVLAYDKYKKDYSDCYAEQASMEELFEYCDVVSFHVPLTEETKFMADEAFFNRFAKPLYLLNTSRGKVVRLKDLLSAIKQGRVLGAGLDVLEVEAFSNELDLQTLPADLQELFLMDNVVFSPHVAGWTKESYHKLAYHLAKKIIELCEKDNSTFSYSYNLDDSVEKKINDICKNVYGAKGVIFTEKAKESIAVINKLKLDKLPIVIAKTQYSLSDNPKLLGAPENFEITIRDIEIRSGAEFLVALAGDMMLMPGLSKVPAGVNMKITNSGKISGLF